MKRYKRGDVGMEKIVKQWRKTELKNGYETKENWAMKKGKGMTK